MTGVDEDPLLARFEAEVRRGEQMDLDRAALLLGLFARPALEVDAYLDRIEAIASGLRAHHGETAPALGGLFAAGGFEGNRTEYYDPRNSFLHDVLDRRLGIPISLSVLAIEAGRRAGMVVEGVPFPGHLLVRVGGGHDRRVLLDPFSGGQIMGDADLLMLARSATGRMGSLGPAELGAATRRQILSRMLNNLKAIYLRTEAIGLALAVQQRLVVVSS